MTAHEVWTVAGKCDYFSGFSHIAHFLFSCAHVLHILYLPLEVSPLGQHGHFLLSIVTRISSQSLHRNFGSDIIHS